MLMFKLSVVDNALYCLEHLTLLAYVRSYLMGVPFMNDWKLQTMFKRIVTVDF